MGENKEKSAGSPFKTAQPNPHAPMVTDIEADELARTIKANPSSVYLVDVRRPDEYTGDLGHIDGTRLLTLDTIPEHVEELPKDQAVVFICRSGGRSAQASVFALQHGYTEVFNMRGGMLKWNELGLPTKR